MITFSKPPRTVTEGVPVFVEPDAYTFNYDAIASDHLASLDQSGVNPFISDDIWSSIEGSTLALVEKHLSRHDRMLDAGVGLGRILSRFPDHERHGVDVAFGYLKRAASQGIHVALAKLEDLPYPDNSFEMVISTDVLEHVLDFYNATREIVRVLKPGGHLIIRVPFEEDMKVYYHYEQYDLVHLRSFDLWTLRIHFERVLKLEFVEERTILPLYRGYHTSLLQPVENNRELAKLLEELPQGLPGLANFKQMMALDRSEFEFLMNAIATEHPVAFKKLEASIAKPLEINVVFRKQA